MSLTCVFIYVIVIEGPISEQYALALRALGCGCCSLAETPSSNLYVSLIDLITASTAQTAAFSLLALLTDTKKDMARLQRAFLFVIRFLYLFFISHRTSAACALLRKSGYALPTLPIYRWEMTGWRMSSLTVLKVVSRSDFPNIMLSFWTRLLTYKIILPFKSSWLFCSLVSSMCWYEGIKLR